MGGMRDAIGMLEVCGVAASTDGTPIGTHEAASLLGTSPIEETAAVVKAIYERDMDAIFTHVDNIYRQARDIGVFWQSLISFYRDMLVIRSVPDPAPLLDLPEKQQMYPRELARRMSTETILYHTRILDEVASVLQRNTAPARISVEMALIRMCDANLDTSPDALLARIADLEDRLSLAGTVAMVQNTAAPVSAPAPAAISDRIPDDGDVPPPWDIPGEEPPMPAEAPPPTEPASPIQEPPAKRTPAPKKAAPTESAPSAAPSPTEKKVLQGLRGWQEAVRRVERTNPIVGSFLREYKVYTCEQDGKVYMRAPNAFSVKLVTTNDDNVTQICAAVNSLFKEPKYAPADLVFDSAEKRVTDGYEMIDDIIESAGDTAETAEH